MKKLLTILIVIMLTCAGAYAGGINPEADFSKTYDNRRGAVEFNHAAHVQTIGDEGDCASCHEMISGFTEVNKDYGHNFCRACHKGINSEYGTSAPVTCTGCHQKE